jgi:uncharacterized protein (TIGR01244 family)
MTYARSISAKVAVGGQPSAEDLERLRSQGFVAVVNLRGDGEADQPLPPAEEGDAAAAVGLAYDHIPVSLAALDADQVDKLRAVVDAAQGPVYVHCGAGQRACALSLLAAMDLGNGLAEDLVAKAAARGFPITDERLAQFVRLEAERRSARVLQAI